MICHDNVAMQNLFIPQCPCSFGAFSPYYVVDSHRHDLHTDSYEQPQIQLNIANFTCRIQLLPFLPLKFSLVNTVALLFSVALIAASTISTANFSSHDDFFFSHNALNGLATPSTFRSASLFRVHSRFIRSFRLFDSLQRSVDSPLRVPPWGLPFLSPSAQKYTKHR